ncbi:MAG: helix-turn-helix transcriptional regulator [Cyanobacteria bacterium]|nr:helix-turn-helix transcriptional regulator [Cyanobacteria bacterium CG_2015-16_32_12]NCO79447.1 helix-turn-helix transcriptional regulator [Cyanobacteria bacterium CG_2015-22_32_23]NCQ03959.1 helix-turn-helix transcriptional regulator [Cyanobacteria bacterium CG_2015-09_32_10]NCQ41460.1 helix-turn-helix transcriptional regulator [Cyanobacteria bacterium CG_2015-04_32_10]NCS84288.1 helix-turn-helix transcriptional regulator [Cyanobacteria bacterium CG_2015-02_32_10]
MDITKKFGEKIRQIRKQQKMSQNELAEKSGLHRTYIGAVERGERNITLINAEKIAQALSVKLFELLKDD